MPRGRKNLQEMEVGTSHVKNVVNSGAKPAESMPKLTTGIPDGQKAGWEDLGGPTPENYKSDDDSAKLKDPAAILAQVRDVVNRGAGKADPMQSLAKGAVKEAAEDDEDYEELDDDEVVEYDEDDEELEEATNCDDEMDEDEDENEDEDDDKVKNKKAKKEEKMQE